MTFVKFSMYPTQARFKWIQRVLGIPDTGKRDRVTVKALTKFQKDHGLTPNGVCSESTFNELMTAGGRDISIVK